MGEALMHSFQGARTCTHKHKDTTPIESGGGGGNGGGLMFTRPGYLITCCLIAGMIIE
jgi:hypothetical protein